MIPIIDLFAGPSGLGEGFMSLSDEKNQSVFDINLSIEKDENAHKTLTLRSFYRQFKKKVKPVPEEYYEALIEKNLKRREELIEKMLSSFPEGKVIRKEVRLVKSGSKNWLAERVDKSIKSTLDKYHPYEKFQNGTPKRIYKNIQDGDEAWCDLLLTQFLKLRILGNMSLIGLKNVPSNYPIVKGFEYLECVKSIEFILKNKY